MTAHPLPDVAPLATCALRWLARALAPLIPPKPPRPISSVRLVREESAMALVFAPDLSKSPPNAPDVVERTLSVLVAGKLEQTKVFAVDAPDVEFTVPQDAEVTIRLRDTDESGNIGEYSPPFTFTAKDTIAPGAPGQLGVTLLREVADEAEPAPEPEPGPTPTPEEPPAETPPAEEPAPTEPEPPTPEPASEDGPTIDFDDAGNQVP